jgi:hypothetical protein
MSIDAGIKVILHICLVAALSLWGGSLTCHSQNLPDDIDISGSPNGIVPLPGDVDPVFTNLFTSYTKIMASNGQAIHFLLQDQVTDEMAVRAREVMRFYLTDVPGAEYGNDKTDIVNRIGSNDAALVYFNTYQDAEEAFEGPLGGCDLFMQDLYASESSVEGSPDYINNTLRDATLEEVFHLVHGAGIRSVLPAYHDELAIAAQAAVEAGFYHPPPDWPPGLLPYEYIITLIDVYYGFWAHDPQGNGTSFYGEYDFNTRAAIEAGDPLGVAALERFLPEAFSFSATVASGFSGTFTMEFDDGVEYTHKSRYLSNVRLSGNNDSDLIGNHLNNRLGGGSGDNSLTGGTGADTAAFQGDFAEYNIAVEFGSVIVTDNVPDRDGTDTLVTCEYLQFSDRTVAGPDAPGLLIVSGPGSVESNPPLVRVFSIVNPEMPLGEWSAYGVQKYGVNVACASLDSSGIHAVITGAGPGAVFGPHVRAFTTDGVPVPGVSYLAYGTHKFGVNVAAGDIDGDGYDEIITGAGPGAVFGPHVRGWNCDGGAATAIGAVSYLAYGTNKWGVNIAAGDIDGDGYDEIITGAGPGAVFGPHVRGWNYDGDGGTEAMTGISFFAYNTPRWGVNVACGDLDGDGYDEIITGPGPGSIFAAHLRAWNYDDDSITPMSGVNLFAYNGASFGLRLGSGDVDGDGIDEILTMPGPDTTQPAQVRGWNVDGGAATLIEGIDFSAYGDLGLMHGGSVDGCRIPTL